MADLPMSQARRVFGSLVRRAVDSGERTTITDHGRPAAVLVNAQELADLEEALALAEYRAEHATRAVTHTVSQHEVRVRLGLPRLQS
jgi:prevent-host-death family protein